MATKSIALKKRHNNAYLVFRKTFYKNIDLLNYNLAIFI